MTTKFEQGVSPSDLNIRLIPDEEFQGNAMTAYRDVLTFCMQNLKQAVEWPDGETLTHDEAVRVQNGFHSSGMGRRLRPTHNILTSVVKRGSGYRVQVKVARKSEAEMEAERVKRRLAAGKPSSGNGAVHARKKVRKK